MQGQKGHQELKTVLDTLVTNGTLTQAQKMPSKQPLMPLNPQGEKVKDEGNNKMETVLDTLVSNGTITQAQEDAIQSALDAARPATQHNKLFNKKPILTDSKKVVLDKKSIL